jgi:hypothetical protein
MATRKGRVDTRQSAILAEASQVLSDYDDKYLDCRAGQHSMRVGGWLRGTGDIRYRYMICPMCGTWRRDRLTSVGERLGATYIHPEDYAVEGLYITKADYRGEQYRRAEANGVVFDDEQSLMEAMTKARVRKARS